MSGLNRNAFVFDYEREGENPEKSKKRYRIISYTAILLLLIFVFGDVFLDGAKDSLNALHLKFFGEEIIFSDRSDVTLEVEFFEKEGTLSTDFEKGTVARTVPYENANALYEATGISLPESDILSMEEISACIYPKEKTGGVRADITYEGTTYDLFGIFTIQDYTPADFTLDFERGALASFTYEAGGGNKAYFVRDWEMNIYNVYFEVGNVLYKMVVSDEKENVERVKEIIEQFFWR